MTSDHGKMRMDVGGSRRKKLMNIHGVRVEIAPCRDEDKAIQIG